MIAPISDDEFRLFRDLIHRECGLYFDENKRQFLSSRIGKRLEARSIGSFYRYYRYLRERGSEQEEELLRLLDLLTINETSFFRNRPQFDFLERKVIPEVVLEKRRSANGARPSLRVWSAGCATGEEPYSIAVTALEALPVPARWALTVYASDLSLSALEVADRGIYRTEKLDNVDRTVRQRWFEPVGDGYRVRPELKKRVVFDFHNLKHDNGLRELDIVFCRNVLIYFDPDEQRRVVNKLIRALVPGGYLFLGHSESIQGLSDEVRFVHHERGTAYKKTAAV